MKEKTEMQKYCDTAENLKNYLKRKATMHNHYKHYTDIKYVLSIVSEKKLYLFNGENWNDVVDRNNFANDNDDVINYGKCFSYAGDESVAMWMLYRDNCDSSAMIDFTRSGMNRITQIADARLGYFDDNKFTSVKTIHKPDFEIYLIDVVYYNKKSHYIKRSDESCYEVDKKIIDELGVCAKTYPWSYENECRLIVSVNKKIIPDGCNSIELDLDGIDLRESFKRVYYGPGYNGDNFDGFKNSTLEGQVDFRRK